MNRADLLTLIEAALAARQPAFARRAAQRYLADWPGDLGLQFALGRAYADEGAPALAASALENLTVFDPEQSAAHRLLGAQHQAQQNSLAAAHAFACAYVGDGAAPPDGLALPGWAASARAAHIALCVADWETARRESATAIQEPIPTPLPSLIHLAAVWHPGEFELALPLAEGFHARWPNTAAFRLCLAECLMKLDDGAATRATELLHDAAALDLTGQVAARHWGAEHPFRALWNANPIVVLPGPMPADLVALLGYNRLAAQASASGEAHTYSMDSDSGSLSGGRRPQSKAPASEHDADHVPEDLIDIQAELDRVADRLKSRDVLKRRLRNLKSAEAKAAFRFVILSSRTRLTQQFGPAGFAAVDAALHRLAENAEARHNMGACLVYVDEPAVLSPFGLRPVNPGSAWDVKMLVAKLAARLKDLGASIGALVIVGGPEIVPFHHLPNPTDDSDADIPSDNPYGTADENYFVAEWPLGRLPSGPGGSPAFLLRALEMAAGAGASHALPEAGTDAWLLRFFRWLTGRQPSLPQGQAFGYSANVWKEASQAVYRSIGDPARMLTSPPVDADALPAEGLAPARLSYFNLHGIEDGPEWYGQRSAGDPGSAPEYPVALRPSDVVNSGRAPLVVFSEACYGANVLGKTAADALCLRFLDSGTRALVGSTKIAYGSVGTPLIGADLLGQFFWRNVNSALPVGEALRRAKLQAAQELHNRQGFLDGEDQKTLISFVLYGDPLYVAPGVNGRAAKRLPVPAPRAPATVCDKADDEAVAPEMEAHIKSVVAQYLPGMSDAQWRVAHPHVACAHDCPTARFAKVSGAKSPVSHNHPTTVVTLSKILQAGSRSHPHFARLTLDDAGRLVKMAVSR